MRRILLAVAAALVLGAPAQARSIDDRGMTVEDVSAWLKSAGYDPKIQKTDAGDRYVEAKTRQGINFSVDLYDCTDGRCRAVQFLVSFDLKAPLPAQKVNEWNRTKRYLRAAVDDGGDPTFYYDANVAPGGTFEALDDDLDVFVQLIPQVLEHIGW